MSSIKPKTGFNRLVKLYQWCKDNQKQIEEEFDFSDLNSSRSGSSECFPKIRHCGSMRCIMGNAPLALPHVFAFTSGNIINRNTGLDIEDDFAELGITQKEADHIFYPMCQDEEIDPDFGMLNSEASLKTVLENFKRFLHIKAKANKWELNIT